MITVHLNVLNDNTKLSPLAFRTLFTNLELMLGISDECNRFVTPNNHIIYDSLKKYIRHYIFTYYKNIVPNKEFLLDLNECSNDVKKYLNKEFLFSFQIKTIDGEKYIINDMTFDNTKHDDSFDINIDLVKNSVF